MLITQVRLIILNFTFNFIYLFFHLKCLLLTPFSVITNWLIFSQIMQFEYLMHVKLVAFCHCWKSRCRRPSAITSFSHITVVLYQSHFALLWEIASGNDTGNPLVVIPPSFCAVSGEQVLSNRLHISKKAFWNSTLLLLNNYRGMDGDVWEGLS